MTGWETVVAAGFSIFSTMKNKRLNRFLLPAVLLIWLAVFFRWESVGEPRHPVSQAGADFVMQTDSLLPIPALNLNYRDPFLDQAFSKKKAFPAVFTPQAVQPVVPPAHRIIFKGIVEEKGEKLALVAIDDQLLYVKKNEAISAWRCKAVEGDKLILYHNKSHFSLQIGKDTLL